MTNREIRARAWTLCKERFGVILCASLISSLVSALMLNIADLFTGLPPIAVTGINIALIALTLVINTGYVFFILGIWNEQPTGLDALFRHANRTIRHIAIVLLPMLINLSLLFFLILFAAITVDMAGPTAVMLIFIAVIAAIFAWAILWISIRFSPAAVCMALHPEMGAIACLRAGWRASHERAGRIFCNDFILSLPVLAMELMLMVYRDLYLRTPTQMMQNAFLTSTLDIAVMLITTLFTGYITLGNYGLYQQLLADASGKASPEASILPSGENTDEDEYIV